MLIDQAGGSGLSPREHYELLAIVRIPHHVLYSEFPSVEWIRTGTWLAVLVVALWLLRARIESKQMAAATAAILLVSGAGAWAAERGGPLFLVQAQTSRLSSFIVLFGLVCGAGALERELGRAAGPLLLILAAVAPRVERAVDEPALDVSGIAALSVLFGLVGAGFASRLRDVFDARRPEHVVVAATIVLALVTVVRLASIERGGSESVTPVEAAWRDVGLRAQELSDKGDVFVTPPDQDGFRYVARRATVVEFGSFRYGEGDREWMRRMVDVTGEPAVVEPSVGTDVLRRVRLIAQSYNRALEGLAPVACRYRARFVVARPPRPAPSWLELAYENDYFRLFRVRASACRVG